MIRTSLLALFILGFSIHALRGGYFLSLCAAIALLGVNNHPDMPRSILGVPGLSPINILLIFVAVGWLAHRRRDGARFDPPPILVVFGALYFAVYLVAWLRLWNDSFFAIMFSPVKLVNDYLLNSIKWVLPGIILFDSAGTDKRKRLALLTICFLYLIFAAQVFHWMPPWLIASGDQLQYRAIRLIENEMGFSRVNVSMMLAGGSWAIICAREMFTAKRERLIAIWLFAAVAFAQGLTGGRMGYVTWMVIGLILSALRWQRYLIIGPILILILITTVPAIRERALTGVMVDELSDDEVVVDQAALTSDRALIWPGVMDMIRQNPIWGYGLEAMTRTGLSQTFERLSFPHPHNAYLEVLLDAGYLGFIPVATFYGLVVVYSGILFLRPRSNLERALGGAALSLTLALLIAGYGSQHFLPQQGGAGMWAAIGLAMRAWADRKRQRLRRVGTMPAPARASDTRATAVAR